MRSERGNAHAAWYRAIASHYDHLYEPRRVSKAYPFLHDLFRRRDPVVDVLDVACGTFALDLPLLKRGYRIVGRDLSRDMLRIARRTLTASKRTADLGQGDMRSLNVDRRFDAVLCLGTAFNYIVSGRDAQRALACFRRHLRPGGLLVLDLTNFAAWIRKPQNARAEVDYHAPDGTRIAIFAFNEQDLETSIHIARFLTVIKRGDRIDIAFNEAPLRMWRKAELARTLVANGFKPAEWWGDLRLGAKYEPSRSPRLVSISLRS